MATRGMTLVSALTLARAKRAIVRPNAGFLKQLAAYEVKLRQIDIFERKRFIVPTSR